MGTVNKQNLVQLWKKTKLYVARKLEDYIPKEQLKEELDSYLADMNFSNSQKLTFTGAVTAEYDGSEAVTVEIPDSFIADDETVTKAVHDYLAENPVNAGVTTAQSNSLWAILQKTAFATQLTSAEISAFKTAWGIDGSGDSGESGGTTEATLTSISATYTGGDVATGTAVTDLTGITVTATYSDGSTAVVTGYTLSGDIVEGSNTITVSYSGLTTTFTVTGVVESGGDDVEAVLITDGLLGYWDLRNPAEVVALDWHWAYPSNEGTGGLYASCVGGSKGTQSIPTFDEYGTATVFQLMPDTASYPDNPSANAKSFGTEFTFVHLTRGHVSGQNARTNGVTPSNVSPYWEFAALYNTPTGTAYTSNLGAGNGDAADDYNFLVKRVNGTSMKVIMDTSSVEINGTDYDDFVSWWSKASGSTAFGQGTSIACAVYDRALSDVEIEEMRAFMKTLEVA